MMESTKTTASSFPRSSSAPLSLLGVLAGLLGACDKSDTAPQAQPRASSQTAGSSQTTPSEAPPEAPEESPPSTNPSEGSEEEAASEPKEDTQHPGPWFWVTRSSAATYKNPAPNKDEKIAYTKRGGQLPILAGLVEGKSCSKGYYKVATGGYICSLVGTTNKDDKDVQFRPRQPDIDEILPYPYARNAKNGTPLYRSIPSKQQTYKYEPYLPGAVAEKERLAKEQAAGLGMGGSGGGGKKPAKKKASPATKPNEKANAKPAEKPPAEKPPPKPLWEREEDLHEVTLEDLKKEGDDVLAQRMMQGFYVAIDKTFKWEDRTYYKTTKGHVTPADRFWQTEGSDFHGVEIDGEKIQLPVGWVFGGIKSAPTYEIDVKEKKVKPKGSKEKFELVQLKYSYERIGSTDYFQMVDGDWIRDSHIRMTTPGKRPKEVGPNERWIDVDISEQTLVVFEGDRPVYATLMSSGKESTVKAKDHSTPRGMWRVREKHVASTMDGDGTAAGDLPYSIEDVPYIMYFHKSYATHGAFWHRNYGVQMSHGCINLAPLDAKWLFFYADPQLPAGAHGNWATADHPGSMIVVHD